MLITETEETKTRGGRRSGSGRPKMGVVRIYVTLDADQVDWLKSRGNVSEQLRELVSAKMEAEAVQVLGDIPLEANPTFVGIGHSGKKNASHQVDESLRSGADRQEGWSLHK